MAYNKSYATIGMDPTNDTCKQKGHSLADYIILQMHSKQVADTFCHQSRKLLHKIANCLYNFLKTKTFTSQYTLSNVTFPDKI